MMRKIRKILSWISNNPSLFVLHLFLQVKKLMPLPKLPVVKKINGVLFEFDFAYYSALKSMYLGSYEVDMVEAMKKLLKKGDIFIDVGANIGYISAIAAGFVGTIGQVHSFEPVPEYFHKLEKIAAMNPEHKFILNQSSLGEDSGRAVIRLSNDENIGWNTMVFLSRKEKGSRGEIEVPIRRLDGYIKEKTLDKVALIKIDVEGFEFPVLKGLSGYLENTDYFPYIICEVNPFACSLMHYSLDDLEIYMKKYNYEARSLLNTNIKIDICSIKETTDVVFLRV